MSVKITNPLFRRFLKRWVGSVILERREGDALGYMEVLPWEVSRYTPGGWYLKRYNSRGIHPPMA